MPLSEEARQAGKDAAARGRVVVAEKLAGLLRRDQDLAATAVEVGLVDRAWMEEPGQHPISTASSLDVVERFLERSSERRPSLAARLGLSAIQALTIGSDVPGDGATQRLTVLFTDLEGFTQFNSRAGDEAAAEVLHQHHRVVGPVIRSRGGRLVKRIGDGLLITFGEAAAGIHAALELVESAPEGLRLRAGLHCGDVVVQAGDVIGNVVNLAARVTEASKGGQVLATAEVVAGAGELRGVQALRGRRRTFKGVDGAVVVHRIERA
jgi:class 3 adenylate cyclase